METNGSSADVLITPEDVLECVMNEGTIDAIRLKIINHLKANDDLKNKTMSMVEHSKVLNTPGAEKHTKRELFDALRHELEIPALERASKSVWELILDNDGLGKEINETVERVFCRLSGREPPLFPSSDIEVQRNEDIEKDNSGSDRENEHLDSSSKKRNFSVIGVQVEDAEGSCHPLPISADSVPGSKTVATSREKSIGAEPNRCHRTDGRSWRCARDSLPNQKFCERHCKNKKSKKQLEGVSSNNAVVSNPSISSSKASQLVTSKNKRRSHSKRQSTLKFDASKGESSL